MYVNRSSAKGDPILADTVTIVTGNNNAPENCKNFLHMFGSSAPLVIDDTRYSFRNDKEGLYLYWASDANAYTASAFSAGYYALAAIGGLALGIVGTAVFMNARRKKDPEPTAA